MSVKNANDGVKENTEELTFVRLNLWVLSFSLQPGREQIHLKGPFFSDAEASRLVWLCRDNKSYANVHAININQLDLSQTHIHFI